MSKSNGVTAFGEFLDDFLWARLDEPTLWSQLAVLLICAGLAWLVQRFLLRRYDRPATQHKAAQGLRMVMFPLLYLILVLIATQLWRQGHRVGVLRLASNLLTAWLVVNVLMSVLHAVFIQSLTLQRLTRPLAGLIWLGFALHISGVLPQITGLLEEISLPLGKQNISLLMIAQGLISVALTLLLTLWIGRLFEQRLMAAQAIDISLRVVITKLVKTVLLVLGVVIALPLVGIDLTVLSVFSGALGVGLGFGLQKIASNYVSGFIILLDGAIRIGDLVNVDNRQGTVSRITARYVVIKIADGQEAIIPNDTLMTSTVLNLSHSDQLLRVAIPLQVAYGTDLDAVMGLLVAQCQDQERILAEPAAQTFVKGFAENGIDLELVFWIADVQEGTLALRSALNLKIWRALQEAGIEIPYPRRDVFVLNQTNRQTQTIEADSSAR